MTIANIEKSTKDMPLLKSKKRIDWREMFFKYLFMLSAAIGILSLVTIGYFIFREGYAAFAYSGVTGIVLGTDWLPPALYGIAPMIVASLVSTAGAVMIGVPIGVLTAIFIAEVAPRPLASFIRPMIELLAGIPSVVYGFFGLVIIVPLIQEIFNVPAGNTILAGIIVLAVMILPTVITISETSIRAVPRAYKEGSLALGASPIFTIFKLIVPAARSGIMTGVILGVARALGETMAIIMVMGNSPAMPEGLLESARTLTANIAIEMSYATGIHASALYATGIVLLVFIMTLNGALLYLNRERAR
ncbi:phosphate ABC transporter permease subunit PstC [Photobacterium phosphoreum]|jgi:phosphate transport system permease protein|uniref:Phosphate transport system permease protein n=1 Tax=Photobacterium phosphoreum TaxID=659 RepID=A0A2T3PNA3_PHOPO|nr:phosphate ABC transporter permease subunit PstC [Photobacterium phosphoreum]KJF85914.1 phosphate ABC transporter permease [Photobacterium phosphoreum]MCD9462904.1 phosphate ABC transporter permease subunit PstC [Photobacterium phosphoreum]MCD9470143.1 phosphate ABC transporter permease subunit PstC [Photobacterium phosphoreum]MCD9475925.1 phosphate ABC transporter permease subunit PstC [Photobacterium phosphoreum]MCD9480629.1 phosphate ABC transporter permease subunit PstC [Photobacterium p